MKKLTTSYAWKPTYRIYETKQTNKFLCLKTEHTKHFIRLNTENKKILETEHAKPFYVPDQTHR